MAASILGVLILIVASAYVSIYRFVQQSKARVKGHTGGSSKEAEQARNLRQEVRMVVPMLAIFVCYSGSWVSYLIVDMMVDPSELHHPWSHILTQFIIILNMIADPTICIVFNHVYRDEIQRLVCSTVCTRRCSRHRPQRQRASTRGGPTTVTRALETISGRHTPSSVSLGAVAAVV